MRIGLRGNGIEFRPMVTILGPLSPKRLRGGMTRRTLPLYV